MKRWKVRRRRKIRPVIGEACVSGCVSVHASLALTVHSDPVLITFVPQRVPRWSGTTSVPGARVRWTNTPQRGRVSAGPRGARERAGRTEQRRLRPPGRRRAAIANSASHEHPSLHVSDSAAVSFFVRRGSCTRTARAGGYLMACHGVGSLHLGWECFFVFSRLGCALRMPAVTTYVRTT